MEKVIHVFRGPIARGTLGTTGALGLRVALQASTLVILARLLGPSGLASYIALGGLAVLFGTLATGGTHLILLRDLSREPSEGSSALRMPLGTTVATGSGLLAIYVLLSHVALGHLDPSGLVALCLGASELLLQPVLLVWAQTFHARGQVVRSQLLLALPLGIRLLIAACVAWVAPSHPLEVFAAGHLLAVSVALGLGVTGARRTWPAPSSWRIATWAEWKDSVRYALVAVGANGLSELDKILAARILAPGIAGAYSAASRVAGALVMPVAAMMSAAMPRLFREGADPSRGLKIHFWLLGSAIGWGIVAAVTAWFVSPLLGPLFGQGYALSGESLRWLACAIPAIALRTTAANILMTQERPGTRLALEIGGWLLLALLTWRLAMPNGLQGMAVALVVTEWGTAFCSWAAVMLGRRHRNTARLSEHA